MKGEEIKDLNFICSRASRACHPSTSHGPILSTWLTRLAVLIILSCHLNNNQVSKTKELTAFCRSMFRGTSGSKLGNRHLRTSNSGISTTGGSGYRTMVPSYRPHREGASEECSSKTKTTKELLLQPLDPLEIRAKVVREDKVQAKEGATKEVQP
jgi:hypothetical protein